MQSLRQFPGFWSGIAGCLIAVCGLVVWSATTSRRAARLHCRAAAEQVKALALAGAIEAADAGAAARRNERMALEDTRRTRLAALVAGERALLGSAPAPRSRIEACGALATLAVELRVAAAGRGVKVAAGEAFGFSEFAGSGPEPAQLTDVDRQSRFVGTVVRMLIESGPLGIDAVRRAAKPRSDLRLAGSVDSDAIEIAFMGYTDTLRAFLNRLARSSLSIAVRSVGVDRVTGLAKLDAPSSLWLEPQPAIFTLCLESARVVDAASVAGEAMQTAASAPPRAQAAPPWVTPAGVDESSVHSALFTSPVVTYDHLAGTIGLRRAGEPPPAPQVTSPANVAAAAAQPRPDRLRLLGYVEVAGEGLATFADRDSGATFVARVGETVSSAAIAVRAIRRFRAAGDAVAGEAMRPWMTEAEVEDLATGVVTRLTDAGPDGGGVVR